MGSNSWISLYFAPALGTLLVNIMWLTPVYELLKARKNRDLGDLNPLPFAAVLLNCIGWAMYGVLKQDYFIFFSNGPGIVIGLFTCMSTIFILSKEKATEKEEKQRKMMETLVLGAVGFWVIVALFVGLVYPGSSMGTEVVGVFVDIISISYYAVPLSTLAQIIRTRDASSLYLPLIAINTLNTFAWVAYGALGTHDITMWLPNGLGLILSLIQLAIIFYYRSFGNRSAADKVNGLSNGLLLDEDDSRDIVYDKKSGLIA